MRPVSFPLTVRLAGNPGTAAQFAIPRHRVCGRTLRTLVTAEKGQNEVRICTSTTCRKQGSQQVVRYFEELVDSSQVTVSESGCLGQCGSGPNLVLLPGELFVKHMQTPAQVARLVKRQVAGGDSVDKAFEVLQLRTEGNKAFERGDLMRAIQLYGEALDVGREGGRHLLHGNRSAARFTSGDIAGAVADAESAIQVAPSWAKGYIRLADALEAMGRDEEALVALHAALDRDDSLMRSSAFQQQLKQVHDRVKR
mmetsp:Transcript_21581/g.47369  ORF Transcript_21581/g.47369 Transcript_21581/m.47369 type:complete len:254 (-) Transcript_21581:208-969(-)